MRKTLLFFIKLFIIVAIFTFLITRAVKGSALTDLTWNNVHISLLLVGFFFNFLATATTLIRWRLLVLALGGKLSLSDAMRLGFIGFMFNLSPVGIIGGDAIKVYLLAKKNHTSVDDATAGVVIDRVIGLTNGGFHRFFGVFSYSVEFQKSSNSGNKRYAFHRKIFGGDHWLNNEVSKKAARSF